MYSYKEQIKLCFKYQIQRNVHIVANYKNIIIYIKPLGRVVKLYKRGVIVFKWYKPKEILNSYLDSAYKIEDFLAVLERCFLGLRTYYRNKATRGHLYHLKLFKKLFPKKIRNHINVDNLYCDVAQTQVSFTIFKLSSNITIRYIKEKNRYIKEEDTIKLYMDSFLPNGIKEFQSLCLNDNKKIILDFLSCILDRQFLCLTRNILESYYFFKEKNKDKNV